MNRLLIITNYPNPYRIPLFNLLHRQMYQKGIRLKVIFGARSDNRRLFVLDWHDVKFDFEILKSFQLRYGKREGTLLTYGGLYREIKRYRPDSIVVVGYSLATFKVLLLSLCKEIKYFIWGGTIPSSPQNNSWFVTIWRKLMVKNAYGFIAYGSLSKQYFYQLGAPKKRVYIALNTVDTKFFAQETRHQRRFISSDPIKHLTYIGYLTKRKNVVKLLEMVLQLSKIRNDFVLDIIGDGEERGRLEKFAEENRIAHLVNFTGFKQNQELPYYLGQSRCFLFQTDFDIWGLVLNEAMAAGVPCLASIHAGATFDLIHDGENGYMVDFNDIDDVISKVNTLLDNSEHSSNMGQAASRFINSKALLKHTVCGFLEAIKSC